MTNQAPRTLLHSLLSHAPGAPILDRLAQSADRARASTLVVLPLGLQAAEEARELAAVHAAIALQGVRHGRPSAPTVILSAGAVLAAGTPAQAPDYLLALLLALDAHPAIHAAACSRTGAGTWSGYLGPDTTQRARDHGLHPAAFAHAGNAGTAARFFEQLGDATHQADGAYGAQDAAQHAAQSAAQEDALAPMVLRAILLAAY
jgi:glycerate-2-kinase